MILKKNKDYKIELHEFDRQFDVNAVNLRLHIDVHNKLLLYDGRASEVTEEKARMWVETDRSTNEPLYKNYVIDEWYWEALDSFHSAHTKEWVIITKTKI